MNTLFKGIRCLTTSLSWTPSLNKNNPVTDLIKLCGIQNHFVPRLLSTALLRNLYFTSDSSRSHTHLLQPSSILHQSLVGYKSYMQLEKRCEHCFFVWREGRLHVECKKKGRHKQRHPHRIQEVLRNRRRKMLYQNFYMGPYDKWPTFDVTDIEFRNAVKKHFS